jgi:hypothetical protein
LCLAFCLRKMWFSWKVPKCKFRKKGPSPTAWEWWTPPCRVLLGQIWLAPRRVHHPPNRANLVEPGFAHPSLGNTIYFGLG